MAGGDRSRADPALLAALAAGLPLALAAQQARISERTARRRLASPAFRAQLDDAQRDLVTESVAALTAASAAATAALQDLLRAGTPPAVRHAAAKSVLELGNRLRAEGDLDRRLAAVEAALVQAPQR